MLVIIKNQDGSVMMQAPAEHYTEYITEGGDLEGYLDEAGKLWQPVYQDGFICGLEADAQTISIDPPQEGGETLVINGVSYTASYAPMTTREELHLPEGAELTDKEIVTAYGKWWLAGDEPTEAPAEYLDAENRAAAENAISAAMQKQAVETAEFTPAEMISIGKAGFFDEWEAGVAYQSGKRLTHEGSVYVVIQEVLSQAHQPPSAPGMLAIYRPVEVSASGTIEDPIPYQYGMDVHNGKYYRYEGHNYLAKADMTPCVWAPGTPDLWQWEAV